MKQVIINADDFGYCSSINRGILEATKNGVVTSASVMVYGKAASEAKLLRDLRNISVGLHVHLQDTIENPQEEFEKQIELFTKLLERAPDHLDVHKPRSSDMGQLLPLLKAYSKTYDVPVRELGHATSIKDFFGINVKKENGVDLERVSVENFLSILDQLHDGVSEIMTHVGYSGDELRDMSSYSDAREVELATLTDRSVKEYIQGREDLELVNWNVVKQQRVTHIV